MIKDFLLTDIFAHPINGVILSLAITFGLMLAELISLRMHGAKMPYQWPLKRTEIWDILAYAMVLTDFKSKLANIIYFGLYAVALNLTNVWNLQFSAYFATDWPIWLKIFLAVILYDFLFYICHRLKHESTWFWNLHEFHHSSTNVTVLTRDRGRLFAVGSIVLKTLKKQKQQLISGFASTTRIGHTKH